MMSGISEDSIWRHPLDRKISRGQFRYDFHRGALGQVRDKGRQFYVNRTDEGVFEYLGVTEAINFYFGIDYRNVSNFRAMERGTRIHSYIEQGIRDDSFKASFSKQDYEALFGIQISRTSARQQKEDIALIRAHTERLYSEMGYADRILSYLKSNYPSSDGWKIHSEYLVSDFTNYASSIDILCTNERTKEAVILDLKTGTIKPDAVNAQTGIYKHFLKNDPRYKDYDVSLGAITIDKQSNKVTMLPLAGISEDQAHDILYPASSFDENSIWYKNKAGVADFAPGYGNPKKEKETKIVYDIFSPDTMRINPLDGKVVSDMFHRTKKEGFGEVVSFDIETLPLSNGTMSLRSFSIFNFTAHRDGRQMKLKYNQGVDERAFLSPEEFTNKTADSLKQRAVDALEKNMLSDRAVIEFEKMHGRQATIATSQDILDIMDKLVGKTVIGHNLLNFDFPQLMAMGKRLAKAEGGMAAYNTFKNRFESKLANMSILDTYELAKELRYRGPSVFNKITVEALIERLSPQDATKIKGLLHQSSADVLATAKVFEVLFNTLPPEEIDFLYKIIKDTKQGKHYTVTSKFETDTRIQRVGNEKGELRAMEASAYGPIGFDLHRTTHYILGDEKTIGGITYRRYDDARKYDQEYNEKVANAITKNQIILKPMDSGKGYYLTVDEEDTDINVVSYTDFTKAELDLKELLRQKGVALFNLPGVSENGKGTPGEYIQRLGFDKSPEHWAMIYDTNLLASYNRMPPFIREQAHKRFNRVRALFGGALEIGRNIVQKGAMLLGADGNKYKLRKFIKFENLVDAYIRNLTLQKSDTVIKYKRGYWKMAGELTSFTDLLEQMRDLLEANSKAAQESINALVGGMAQTNLKQSQLAIGLEFKKMSLDDLVAFKNSKEAIKLLGEDTTNPFTAYLNSILETTIKTKQEEAARKNDFTYKFDISKALPGSFKDKIRPLFTQSTDQTKEMVVNYLAKAKSVAAGYGYKEDIYAPIVSKQVTTALKEGTYLGSPEIEKLTQEAKQAAFVSSWREGFWADVNNINEVRKKARITDYEAQQKSDAKVEEALKKYAEEHDPRKLVYSAWDKAKEIEDVYKKSRLTDYIARQKSEAQIDAWTKETDYRKFNAERFMSQNIMFSADKKKLLDATNAAKVSSKEYAQTLSKVHDNTLKLNRVLGATVSTLSHIPLYNPDQLFSAGYNQIGSIHKSLNGVIPSFLNTSVTKMLMGGVQDYELGWQKWKYGLKSATPALSLIGGTLGAVAGAPFGASMQMGAMGASALGGLGAWASQIVGNRYERAINETGLFFSSRFNKMGALLTPAIYALNLFTKALKIATVPLLAGVGMGLYQYRRALNNMNDVDTPFYNLTGISYGRGYDNLVRSDYMFGMKKGTTNNIIEGIEFAKQSLFTLGQYDKSKLITSAMLGVFSEAFIPNKLGGIGNFEQMMNKLYTNYKNSSNKGRFMGLLNMYNPELAKQIQTRTDMDAFFATNRGQVYAGREMYYNNLTYDQSNEFKVIRGIQAGFGESIKNSLMKIAAGLYNWKGFDFMNKYVNIVGTAANAFADNKPELGLQIIGKGIREFIEGIGETWTKIKAELNIKGLGDTIIREGKLIGLTLADTVLDFADKVLTIVDKLEKPAKRFFLMLYEQFKKLFDFVGQIRLQVDWKKLKNGEPGAIQFKYGYDNPGFSDFSDSYAGKRSSARVASKDSRLVAEAVGTGLYDILDKEYGLSLEAKTDAETGDGYYMTHNVAGFNKARFILRALEINGLPLSEEGLETFLRNRSSLNKKFKPEEMRVIESLAGSLGIARASAQLDSAIPSIEEFAKFLGIDNYGSLTADARKIINELHIRVTNDKGELLASKEFSDIVYPTLPSAPVKSFFEHNWSMAK